MKRKIIVTLGDIQTLGLKGYEESLHNKFVTKESQVDSINHSTNTDDYTMTE